MVSKQDIKHLAVIMDGNGRWAERKNVDRVEGHRAGAQALKNIVDATIEQGIKYLTVYAFSTENWKRSPKEVNALMKLLRDFVDKDLLEIHGKNIKVQAIGQLSTIPWPTRRKLLKAIDKTKDNTGGTLTLALSYGGRAELVDAVQQIAGQVNDGTLKIKDINEDLISQNMYDPTLPDPDLMIRTSGELRTSNFLLWQLSYAEFYFTDVLWPDFNAEELQKAVDFYHGRDRRFGGR